MAYAKIGARHLIGSDNGQKQPDTNGGVRGWGQAHQAQSDHDARITKHNGQDIAQIGPVALFGPFDWCRAAHLAVDGQRV